MSDGEVMSAINRQLKKGFVDILLLALMTERPMYGYELMTALDERSRGFFAMKEGTLYPVLYRMEDAGYIRSSWAQESTARRGAPRKYYEITDAGRTHLQEAAGELRALMRSVERIMGRIE